MANGQFKIANRQQSNNYNINILQCIVNNMYILVSRIFELKGDEATISHAILIYE